MTADSQRALHERVAKDISAHLDEEPLKNEDDMKQAAIRLKLWDDINAYATIFREEAYQSSGDDSFRGRFSAETKGDAGVFELKLRDDSSSFE
jgi:hypothetical protein